jgi:phage-related protein
MVAWNNQQAAVGMGDSCNPEHTSPAVVVNMGTLETPIIVELKGPATNPEITIGNEALKYFGALTAGDTLTIDTDRKTVKFNGVNALANYSGGFPQIPPGQTTVFYDGDGILTLKWHDKWI